MTTSRLGFVIDNGIKYRTGGRDKGCYEYFQETRAAARSAINVWEALSRLEFPKKTRRTKLRWYG